MSTECVCPERQRDGERGSIIIMTAIFMLLLFLMLGLCIDVSRIYMIRAELQNAADAAALSAARELNSGSTGIDGAVARATNIVNSQGFEKFGVTITSVEFSTNPDGGFISAAAAKADVATAESMQFVRVTTETTSTAILFGLAALGSSHAESRNAVAGMSRGVNTVCDFFPIAVALPTPYPSPGTVMTLNFTQGTNNSATLAERDYIILEVPDINGNGAVETGLLTAGLTNICQSLDANIPFHMTPSSNVNNGPRQITDGVNTRFNIYANGYGNQLQPGRFPPDKNIATGISFEQYKTGSSVTPPPTNGPGQDERRIMLVPIIEPDTYTGSPVSAPTQDFGAFFLRRPGTVTHPCSQTSGCAQMEVEWIDKDLILGRGFVDPSDCSSRFALAVLYR